MALSTITDIRCKLKVRKNKEVEKAKKSWLKKEVIPDGYIETSVCLLQLQEASKSIGVALLQGSLPPGIHSVLLAGKRQKKLNGGEQQSVKCIGQEELDRAAWYYSARGHLGAMELLLLEGANPNAKHGGDMSTCLHEAALNWHTEIVKLLLDNGADIDAEDRKLETPLFKASEHGRAETVRFLLSKGAAAMFSGNRWTCLHVAASNGQLRCMEILIAAGYDVDARDNHMATPLHLATHAGHEAAVSLLLRNGAPVSARDRDGMTPDDIALKRGYTEILRLLLEAGAAQ